MAVPLRMGLPALDLFPRKLWSRLAARQARLLPAETLDYGVSRGLPALRRAIVSYLSISRGIVCDPGQVFITAGYQGALRLIGTALLQPGDQVWHEDPGYFRAREALALMGMDMVPVPVDDEGLVVEQGMALAPQARLALVTPSHQAPLGMALSLPRRLALLAWAAQHGGWIVEDDYDSEFRYVGRPLPALKSLDSQGRVLYAGTFSKVLFPGLASGYLVVPAALVDAFTHAAQLTGSAPSPLVQGTIAAFLEEGHFTRHIRNMRSAYAERRAALARALERHASDHMRVELKEGGMHLVGWLSGGDDIVAVQRLHAQGLLPAALSPWGVSCRPAPALLMSFTNVAPAQAETMAARVAAALLSST
jgi:GntR family transcriptional regulator/MocR family aminotransferase